MSKQSQDAYENMVRMVASKFIDSPELFFDVLAVMSNKEQQFLKDFDREVHVCQCCAEKISDFLEAINYAVLKIEKVAKDNKNIN